MKANSRVVLLTGLAALSILVVLLMPPVSQSPEYHRFADQRTIFGIPNFWNVVSNAPFLLVAMWGFRRPGKFVQAWERRAHLILLAGLAAVAFGSSYYHAHPDDATLFWDRLPMAVVLWRCFLSQSVNGSVPGQGARS